MARYYPIPESVQAGTVIPVEITLVGRLAPAIIDDLLRALADAGRAPGIGEDRVTFRLTRGGSALAALGLRTEDLPAPPRAVPGVVPRLGVGLTAPLFLQKRSRTARRLPVIVPSFADLAVLSLDTIDRLFRHHDGTELRVDREALRLAAEQVPLIEHCYAPFAQHRWSTRGPRLGPTTVRVRRTTAGPKGHFDAKGTTGGGVYGDVPWALVLWGGLLHVGWHRVAGAGGWRLLLD